MKSFSDFLFHTQKIYEFRIKLAEVSVTPENLARIRNALEAYCVEEMGNPKRLPIQEHKDFPKMGPCECHIIDVSLKYPTTTEQLQHVVAERALLDKSCVVVTTKAADEATSEAEALGQGRTTPALTDGTLEDQPGGQELVGQRRLSSFIKELSKNKVSKFEIAGKEKADGTTSDSLPQGTKSPVGSSQNKIPSPLKGK
jgi:hypothetical protein